MLVPMLMPIHSTLKCRDILMLRRPPLVYDAAPRRYIFALRHHRGKHLIEMSGESLSPRPSPILVHVGTGASALAMCVPTLQRTRSSAAAQCREPPYGTDQIATGRYARYLPPVATLSAPRVPTNLPVHTFNTRRSG